MSMRIEDLIRQYNARRDDLDKQGAYFVGDINPDEAERFSKSMLLMSMERHGFPDRPLSIYINSGGGTVGAGFAMIEMIQKVRAMYAVKVNTIVTGYAYSMGATLLQAGDWRTMGYFSTVMIHSGSWNLSGEDEKVFKDYRKLSDLYQNIISELFARRTGLHNPSWWRRFIYSGRDRFLSAHECLKLGLVDEIANIDSWHLLQPKAGGPTSLKT
ncbi:MAG: ATP-dependent Clp protease proteolytic subunit [Dehalococcoidia bacterium]|nr:ATP-dependent Clp protease proteolytic subunit [Dehalococcoidia bacterium]